MGCFCFRRKKKQNKYLRDSESHSYGGPRDSHKPKLDKKKSSSTLRYMECFSECFSLCVDCGDGGGGGDWVWFHGGGSYIWKNFVYEIVCMYG